MNWWLIFGGIVLLGLVQTALLVWWLWRRSRALVAELSVLAKHADELVDILSHVQMTEPGAEQSS